MDNWLFVFIITFIGSFVLVYGIGSIIGGENIEFIYLFLFIVQFSFTTTILFQILHRLKQVEKKDYHKE
ncbi:hypothetical protein UB32_01230 [Mesobacillus subterraneus]|uniref:Uncharacterized protein n=2 Tax=Mesobacillus TaxID=2675231 RepID=A0A0D6ZE13_9BACI|nr:hypothetical protein UB32_01230 [Mesobacillus subterraneus]MDQ0413370.1 divalent metal cation (Fe/Co/Zn/Cd) transporter [Mesobacillus stamsii]